MYLSPEFQVLCERIDFANAEAVKREGAQLLGASASPVQVDLGGLQRANTLAVAVMVAWYRRARQQDKAMVFVNLSDELRNIVTFSGLAEVLLPEAPND